MSYFTPTIVLLKEGTDSSQGKGHLLSNIDACVEIVNTLKTTLGPRGMDKLITNDRGKSTVTNDGATVMRLLDVVHPAVQTLVDIAMSQDSEVGDGTTSVVVFAGEILEQSRSFIKENVHPQTLIKAFRKACFKCRERIKEIAIESNIKDEKKWNSMLKKCASTAMNSKLIAGHKDAFSDMVVQAVRSLDPEFPEVDLIGIKKVGGGAMEESFIVNGVAFKKTFSYAGFEQQPKKFTTPKIALLNIELELKNEKENAEIRIKDPKEYQKIVEAEWELIYEKLEKIVESGANIVLSRLPIGDLATQYFADRDIFCAGRVEEGDMKRLSVITGKQIQSTTNGFTSEMVGECELMEEKQIGSERYNIFTGFEKQGSSTIILRGGAEQFLAESERSLHDAIMVVHRAMLNSKVVAGGGAIEMELSRYLHEYAKTIYGKEQMLISAFAKALEIIPRQISQNAGFDSVDIMNKLRKGHYEKPKENIWMGVDIENEGVCDTMKSFVWEPSLMKLNMLSAATDAACLVLSVDETVKSPSLQENNKISMEGRK
ncbi:t-complex protein 1 subunit eta [Anaeramoeba flamelloides]|uniref:T-complex protein 1 subunit eta n=1 Tax=Anaeramoeba flamelloides TaxID=1746091 RepID=A0ABQ8Y648_9EUKA|nr:t-complex protein 1 subunit eta [Anaeramoeba flamelloides]KAJ6239190.1 t-complex protein 1 subunit eta [Anaeramoeba flamelloides]